MEIEKSARLLYLYQDFIKGAGIQKKTAADRFGVNERSLQRDIEDLRCFFANQTPPGEIIYDARQKVYRLILFEQQRSTGSLQNSAGKPFHAAGRDDSHSGQAGRLLCPGRAASSGG